MGIMLGVYGEEFPTLYGLSLTDCYPHSLKHETYMCGDPCENSISFPLAQPSPCKVFFPIIQYNWLSVIMINYHIAIIEKTKNIQDIPV